MERERRTQTCRSRLGILLAALTMLGAPIANSAGQTSAPTTRETQIEMAQAEKLPTLHSPTPGAAEQLMAKVQRFMDGAQGGWHPFFESAYPGGGFALGSGYRHHVSPYNLRRRARQLHDQGYKRAEAEFLAPRLFHRRGTLSLLGGWREATQVGFFGVGTRTPRSTTAPTTPFKQPYASALLTVLPTRRFLLLQRRRRIHAVEAGPGEGRFPRSTRVTRRHAAGPRREPDLSALARHRRLRLADLARLLAARRLLRRHLPRFHRPRRRVRLPAGRLRSDSALSDPPRGLGPLAARRSAARPTGRRPGDSVLHAAVARRRPDAARLRVVALPRSQQPAAAGGVADHGRTASSTPPFFYDAGKVASAHVRPRSSTA